MNWVSDVDSLFANIKVAGSITNPYAREKGTTVLYVPRAKGGFSGVLEEEGDGSEK